MSGLRPTRSGGERAVLEALRHAESLLRASAPDAPGDRARRAEALASLEAALGGAPAAARRYARRIEAVRALHALRARSVPDDALDGLYEAVRARTIDADPRELAWRRAGMSRAFLDAPRSLARWRRAAVAACAVLVVGVGLVATRQVGVVAPEAPEDAATTAAQDPRDDLLLRLSPVATEEDDRDTWLREVGTRPRAAQRLPRLFQFTLVPRRDMDAGAMLDAVPAVPVRAVLPAGDLEKN